MLSQNLMYVVLSLAGFIAGLLSGAVGFGGGIPGKGITELNQAIIFGQTFKACPTWIKNYLFML